MRMEDPMLNMLEWLCRQMMEAEASGKIGADKHEQSQERTSHRCGFWARRRDTWLGTMYESEVFSARSDNTIAMDKYTSPLKNW